MAQSKSLLNDLSHALDLLKSENARLLDDNELLQWIVTDDELLMEKVLADNAKLRKLVEALLQCHVEDTDTCAKCDYRSPLHGGCMADVSADNLGVEVD